MEKLRTSRLRGDAGVLARRPVAPGEGGGLMLTTRAMAMPLEVLSGLAGSSETLISVGVLTLRRVGDSGTSALRARTEPYL